VAEKRGLVRGAKVDRLVGGLKFVAGVDPDLPRTALERALAGVPDESLDDAATVKPILDAFAARNKALLLDESGGGVGTGAKGGAGTGAGGAGGKSPDQMTMAEREADLRKQKIL
jgi:hypothetical protein